LTLDSLPLSAKGTRTRKREDEAEPPPPISEDRPTKYARGVVDGTIVAGPLVRAAARRHLADLETAHERGWTWDLDRANYALDFFPVTLRLNGGRFEGKPFKLSEWQAFIVGSLFGWVDEFGARRFQSAYLEIGKGNGKSPIAAGIGLYMLGPDGESRAEVYAAASKKDQAMVLFRDAVAMVDLSPAISSKIVKSGGRNCWNLSYPKSGSFFRAIASDDGQSGPRPHCALLDEVHEHPNDTMVEMMRAGFKGREQPLILMITNSGHDKSTVCWAQHAYAERVVTGLQDDDRYFAYVCGLDTEDDPFTDESCWIKANPNLGVSITLDYLRGQVKEARGMPSKQSKVKRLNFCMWVDAANPWIVRDVWEACEEEFDPETELVGEECVGGLDLSGTRDLTALALYFTKQRKASNSGHRRKRSASAAIGTECLIGLGSIWVSCTRRRDAPSIIVASRRGSPSFKCASTSDR
jgi:phage terminase large subunit-like protein